MRVWLLLFLCFYQTLFAKEGTWINPVEDISWKCLFPITVAKLDEGQGPKPCICRAGVPKVGLPISFYEPSRLIEVTMTPYKLVGMGGIKLSETGLKQHGSFGWGKDQQAIRYYQVHWYYYPVLFLLELLSDFVCVDKGSIDLAWMTEFDPTWNHDMLNMIFHPEAFVLANPIAQGTCVVDCLSIEAKKGGFDNLFWCAGCLGGVYPFSGFVSSHKDPWHASALLASRLIAKFHRMGLLKLQEPGEYCQSSYQPLWHKSSYRLQLAYPKRFSCCIPGKSQLFLEKATSLEKEDFVYVLWKKKNCCLDPLFYVPSDAGGL